MYERFYWARNIAISLNISSSIISSVNNSAKFLPSEKGKTQFCWEEAMCKINIKKVKAQVYSLDQVETSLLTSQLPRWSLEMSPLLHIELSEYGSPRGSHKDARSLSSQYPLSSPLTGHRRLMCNPISKFHCNFGNYPSAGTWTHDLMILSPPPYHLSYGFNYHKENI